MSSKELPPRLPNAHRAALKPDMLSLDPLDLYLQEIHHIPPLTLAEEREIGEKMDAGKAAEHTITAAKHTITDVERMDRETSIAEGQDASDWLASANQRLVVNRAKNFRDRGVLFLDLIQEGNIGLYKAIEKMRWKQGTKFSTVATWWIDQTIGRAVANTRHMIRIPVHLLEQIRHYQQCRTAFVTRHGREATPKEIAGLLGKTEQQVKRYQQLICMQPASLDNPISSQMDGRGPTVEQIVEERDTASYVHALLALIPPKEASVLNLRYGLADGETKTLTETGKILGIPRNSVRRLENQATRRLSNMVEERNQHTQTDDAPQATTQLAKKIM